MTSVYQGYASLLISRRSNAGEPWVRGCSRPCLLSRPSGLCFSCNSVDSPPSPPPLRATVSSLTPYHHILIVARRALLLIATWRAVVIPQRAAVVLSVYNTFDLFPYLAFTAAVELFFHLAPPHP